MAVMHADPGFLSGSSMPRSFLEALSGSSSIFPELKRSSFRGVPALLVSEEEFFTLAEPFKFSLVGFFPSRRPSLASVRKFFFNLKLNGDFSVTLLDHSHVLIKLENDLDYSRIFCHRSYLIFNCFMRVTKWSPSDDVSAESLIVPVWISFPNLRPHFFSTRILHGLGLLFGRPLKVDNATALGSRPSVARVLVELDVTQKFSDKVWLGPTNLGYFQQVVLEDFPSYNKCKRLGHSVGSCQISCDNVFNAFPPKQCSPKPVVGVSEVQLGRGGPNASDLGGPSGGVVPLVGTSMDIATVSPVVLPFSSGVAAGSAAGDDFLPPVAPYPKVVAIGSPVDEDVEVYGCGVDGLVCPVARGVDGPVCPASLHAPITDNNCCISLNVTSTEEFVPPNSVEAIDGSILADLETDLAVEDGYPDANGLEGKAEIVDIPISVVSNSELKSHVNWSLNNSVLVQSSWLDLEESVSMPSLEGDDIAPILLTICIISWWDVLWIKQFSRVVEKEVKANLRRNSSFAFLELMLWDFMMVWPMMRRLPAFHFFWLRLVGNLGDLSPMDGPCRLRGVAGGCRS
ncbi:hypothetical protein M5K25_018119 [Dendrobium thyrsiflorum]|uniref:DUF4283 domain-containing protein n=1 Tax=Dendrobium thyrsiflorum TaxID=117978 RepID=A0ABD0UPD5_DENTH